MADRIVKKFRGNRRKGLRNLEKYLDQVINSDARYVGNESIYGGANVASTLAFLNLVNSCLDATRTIHTGE